MVCLAALGWTLRLRSVENPHFSRKERARNGAPGIFISFGGPQAHGHSGQAHEGARPHTFHSVSTRFSLGEQFWGGFQEGAGVGVGGARGDLIGVADLDDFSPVHNGDASREIADHRHGMRDEQIGQAEVALQLCQKVHDLRSYTDVERGDWFVAHDELWPKGEGAGDTDALALSPGELVGVARAGGFVQAYGAQQLGDASIEVELRSTGRPGACPELVEGAAVSI